jgi:hypothetical protein
VADTKEVLARLKRRIGRERGRARRIEKAAFERNDGSARERARGEENVLALTMGFIDEELKKL